MATIKGVTPTRVVVDEVERPTEPVPAPEPPASGMKVRTGGQEVEVAASAPKADGTRDVWYRWNDDLSGPTWTTSPSVWQHWVTAPTTSTTIALAEPMRAVWENWATNQAITLNTVQVDLREAARQTAVAAERVARGVNGVAEAVRPMTEQMRAELQRERDRVQAAREAASARRLADQKRLEGAQERGMELFLSLLTVEEAAHFHAHDGREVQVVGQSGRRYLIEMRSVHGNIVEVDEHGCRLGRVCVAPGMYDQSGGEYLALPLADGWVGQYLAVKYNEEVLRATGNWSHMGRCTQPQTLAAALGRVPIAA